MAKLLIVVDMQNDFVTGNLSTPEAAAVVAPIVQKIEQYRAKGVEVLFTMDTHLDTDWESDQPPVEATALPKHCIRDSDGWQLVDELRAFAQSANTLEKPTFMGLDLRELVERYIQDTQDNTIELCGVCTDICVLSNALFLRAAFPRTKIVIDPLCCAGVSPQAHEAALTVMRSCMINVI